MNTFHHISKLPAFVMPGSSSFTPTRLSTSLSPRCTTNRIKCAAGFRPPRMLAKATSLELPSTLQNFVDSFASMPDQKMRYQQLLFFAKQLPTMHPSLKLSENLVTGCTSVVYVHISLDDKGLVHLQGDSDSQLTKGLLALLIKGLDGATPTQIEAVDPSFITISGLSVSLTPSRNNGFINMLAKIKLDVKNLTETTNTTSEKESTNDQEPLVDVNRPIYSAIMTKLRFLKPTQLHIRDDSAQHAGHMGSKGLNGESHFAVSIVSEAFQSLRQVQRHRLIYTLLDEEMSAGHIHALQISAITPEEAAATS